MTVTALSLMAEELKLAPNERAIILTMLRLSPVSIRAEETLIPVKDLVAALPVGVKSFHALKDVVEELMKTKRTESAKGDRYSFSLLMFFEWVDDSKFLRFQLNLQFCSMLKQLALVRKVSPF
ncbi:hypothetical protein [Herbaspirillum sp. RV1423]|uniref:hypothetical protein n=1 Tax=Herbaspirillum sp. RV1423 TaxID=1443993 RepID=UPI00055151F2|nr:hypothetical protein [Herbaspirillum sp. RV1423]